MSDILSSPVHTPKAGIIFYIHSFRKSIFIHYHAHLHQSRVISLNTSGGKLEFWHKSITLSFGTIILWMYTSASLYFNFMFKNTSFGRKEIQMVLSAEIPICQMTRSQKQWVKQLFSLLCAQRHPKSWPDWPEDMGVRRSAERLYLSWICIIFLLDPVFTQNQ